MKEITMPNGTFEEVQAMQDGFQPIGNRFTEAQLAGAVDLIRNAAGLPAHRHEYLLKEAITTSDFPYLFGTVIEHEMLARYRFAAAPFKPYTKVSTLLNFNIHQRHMLDGLTGRLPIVGEKGEYLVSPKPIHSRRYIQLIKKGMQFDISWESLINDGLGAFSDVAQRYADAAANTEYFDVTSLYSSAAGRNVLLYGAPIVAPDGSNVTNVGVLPLTIANLETTIELMARQTDALGNPLGIRALHLVVPPGLEFTARQILTSATKMWVNDQVLAAVPMPTNNVVAQIGLQMHINPWLPVVDATGNDNGTWYLFADTTHGYAIEFAYLRGHETPEICMKSSDKVTPAGALLSPFSGDFATDNVFYRVRTVTGGTQLDPRLTYAQVNT
jgi:hypothetical protein